MKEIENHYILQDSITQKYFCLDKNSGGYPYFSDNYKSAEKFADEEAINILYYGGKWNGAYKTMFPKECENLITKLVTVITEII